MKIQRNSIILVLLLILFKNCTSVIVKDRNFKLKTGGYYGSIQFFVSYLVAKDSLVYVDFYLWDKFPRDVICDTLSYNKNKTKWHGKFSEIYNRKNRMYVQIVKDTSWSPKKLNRNWNKHPLKIKKLYRADLEKYLFEYRRVAIINRPRGK